MRWRLQRSGEFNVCYFYTAFSGSFVVLFPGKASVELRPHDGFPSLSGWRFGGRFLLVRTSSSRLYASKLVLHVPVE